MKYELPKYYKLSKKEEQEISEKLNTTIRRIVKSFLNGFFFFLTIPISIYNKNKQKRKSKEYEKERIEILNNL